MTDGDDASAELVIARRLWEQAQEEASARTSRAASARFWSWISAIGVSLAAMLATFVGLPLVAAMSVLLASISLGWAASSYLVPRLMPRDALALDTVRSLVLRTWQVLPSREQAAVLVEHGSTFCDPLRVIATVTDDDVQVRTEELLPPEPGFLWL